MARNVLHISLTRTRYLRAGNIAMQSNHHLREEEEEEEEGIAPQEWYEAAFSKMKKWSHSLKELDLIGGRLVNISDHSRIFDAKLEKKMRTFKSIGRELILLPSTQETLKNNLMASSADQRCKELDYFRGPHERDALTVSSLTKATDHAMHSPQWGDALGMCIDLVSCLSDESELTFHVSKLELMNEGLFQIRDVLIDTSRYQERLVQRRLTRALGHSSKC